MADPTAAKVDTAAVREAFPYQRVHALCDELDTLRAALAAASAITEAADRYRQAWEAMDAGWTRDEQAPFDLMTAVARARIALLRAARGEQPTDTTGGAGMTTGGIL